MVSEAADDGFVVDLHEVLNTLQLWTLNSDWTDLLFQRTVSWNCCGLIVITVLAVG